MISNEYIKGMIKTIVLKLLSERSRMYGYEINSRVEELSNGEIKLTYGALYPILYKLEKDGLLRTTSEVVDNRARKYYSLTEQGKEMAKDKVSELKKFNDV
ncbi:MAG: PadR family transcriptional regulator, partial [Fulvivirga sp.]|uniref:PadR family transcriptional regulator n=1 Tax=Fulvivirga sp. TaxID=1931237 RepID=UPI0032EF621D